MHLLPTFAGTPARNTVYHTDALSLLRAMPDASVDAFITDLPYGMVSCNWDVIIPFEPMWAEVKRTLKPRGVFVTTASQPFTSKLIMSNLDWFKYTMVWDKKFSGNINLADIRPMKTHEDICVFSAGGERYYPQMVKRDEPIKGGGFTPTDIAPIKNGEALHKIYDLKYPISILDFPRALGNSLHPTQKSVPLFEYLINTYTQPGELVVDFCAGSGTTAVAARNLKRDYIVSDNGANEQGVLWADIMRDRLRTSILEPRHVSHDNDVTTMKPQEGYKHTLFALAANA